MRFSVSILAFIGLTAAAPVTRGTDITVKSDNADEYVVYPDIDRDEDVVYAYHAVNDKRDTDDEYVVYPDVDRDEDVVYAYHAVNDK